MNFVHTIRLPGVIVFLQLRRSFGGIVFLIFSQALCSSHNIVIILLSMLTMKAELLKIYLLFVVFVSSRIACQMYADA